MLKRDPTCHAEIETIRAASLILNPQVPSVGADRVNQSLLELVPPPEGSTDPVPKRAKMLTGHELYVLGAPCPMCMSAVYWARIDAVYFANDLEATREIGFEDAFQYEDFVKPLGQRRIHIEQFEPELAVAAYQAWASRPHKHPY